MPEYYYSAQTFLAWCLSHYFYEAKHFAYIGAPFYPFSYGEYIRKNPPSSNPYKIYGNYYEYYLSDDHYSIQEYRNRLKVGIGVKYDVEDTTYVRLIDICNFIKMDFFFPLLYRVKIDYKRRDIRNSGLEVGSKEFVIEELLEDEFDVLFADFSHEEKLAPVFEQLWQGSMKSADVLLQLEAHFS